MKIRFFLILILSVIMVDNSFGQTAESYLNDLTTGKWRAKSPVNVVSMNDGERFAYISNDRKQIVVDFYKTTKPQVIFDIDKVPGSCPFKEIEGFAFDPNEAKILIEANSKPIYRHSVTSDYYIYNIGNNRISPLSESGSQQLALFSPNGRMVAFARDNNLYLKKLDFDTESAVTKDGKRNEVINGTADWVYEEEFSEVRYFAFSPDNKLLAFVKFNEKDVDEFSMQIFNDLYPTLETFKYPKAGTANSKVSVWVYDIENRTTTRMNVEGDDFYIPSIKWTNSADALAVVKLSRDQKNIELLSLNPRSGVATKLYGETSKTFSDYRNFKALQFCSDNSFVIMSEKDGYRHIYIHTATGIQKEQLTKGKFDVIAFYGYDEKSKTVYYQAAKNNPAEREVYKSVKGKMSQINSGKGLHSARFSTGFKYAIHNYSNQNTPNIYSVIDNSGRVVRRIEENSELKDKYGKSSLPSKKFFTFTTPQGVELNGWMIEPLQMPKDGKPRIVLTQYSGPDSQEVLNRWDYDWEYYLALNGFVVVCVDGRGTGGRGNEFRTCTYGQLGVLEAQDQIATANYMKDKYPDAKIGIWGWSYGGFMTLQCMTSEGSPFDAGVAIAPVVDWRLYNTAYTERFMNRPQENFDGYERTSVLNKADKLKGNLLIIHGTADDNVHAQNTYLMAEQLVEAGIVFDMQIYTDKNHSIVGSKARSNIYKRCMEFFYEKLR